MFQKFGRYEIIEPIGNGSFGMVYRANDPNLDRVVAIKVINQLVSDPQVLADIRNEARLTANLDHPNVVRIYDFEVDNSMAYIVMPFLPDCLANHIDEANPFPYQRAVEMATQIARGLGYAHSQEIVHRDIKPSNILMTSDENLQVADFGIARTSYRMERTYGAGTLLYMAPELWTEDKGDYRVDVYSLGVTLFEMLTGYRPFQGPSQRDLLLQHTESPVPSMPAQLGIPEAVEDIVRKAMAKNPNDRFDDADDMADALARLLTGGFTTKSKKDIEVLSESIESFLVQGDALLDATLFTEAASMYSEIIRLSPNDDHAFHSRGFAYRRLGRYHDAISDQTNAIHIDSDFADAYCERGRCYFELNESEHAMTDFNKAIQLDPDDINAHWFRGLSYTLLNQHQ